jgi:hypothetical protein
MLEFYDICNLNFKSKPDYSNFIDDVCCEIKKQNIALKTNKQVISFKLNNIGIQ